MEPLFQEVHLPVRFSVNFLSPETCLLFSTEYAPLWLMRLSRWIPAALRRQKQILVRADLQRPFSTENGFDLSFALKGNVRSLKAMSNSFRENNLVPDA
jgi:hypothetical protein